ncbi:MAG: DNA gyrase subunit A, partial [Ruminococcus sp.]
MAKKRTTTPKIKPIPNAYIEKAGIVEEERITDTLEKNYMPYAMSVIISRALPEIDGFKPSHRKLLYTMYKMGLLNGGRTKSANVVGQTMRLNPHGDSAIYDTMVRLARGNESLLYPYVDSKGNFGKAYSRDMAYAASRYTEVKLEPICNELFRDIDKDTVDFVPNYDNTMMEPTLFPTTFPSVLVNANVGIAVSMASNVCPFNLTEVCDTTIALLKNPEADVTETLLGPDFPGGGFLLKDADEFRKICETGRGSVKVRAKWNYDKAGGCIEVTEIPYSTTIEAIMDKIVDGIKQGKLREISYVRDETDLSGLKIAIDLKRGADPEKV